jgi:predicted nucleic acid-binding Zn ribbon protein
MPTYVYVTIPQAADELPEQFEIQQSMRDDALTRHPEDGRPVKRVITGGLGYLGGSKESSGGSAGGGSCGAGCGCHH